MMLNMDRKELDFWLGIGMLYLLVIISAGLLYVAYDPTGNHAIHMVFLSVIVLAIYKVMDITQKEIMEDIYKSLHRFIIFKLTYYVFISTGVIFLGICLYQMINNI